MLQPTRSDKTSLQDHCGIVALFSPTDKQLFSHGLTALKQLQTRGYDGAGFWAITAAGNSFAYKNEGMIDKVFDESAQESFLSKRARVWLFQTRYGTSGSFSEENVQPFFLQHHATEEKFCIIHNGQFSLREPHDYQNMSDTNAFAQAIASNKSRSWFKRLTATLTQFKGAYSLVLATKDALYCARDALGIRPMVYGKLSKTPPFTWVVASETASLKAIGAVNFKEVLPGSVVKLSDTGLSVLKKPSRLRKRAACIFENVYLMEEQSQAHLPRQDVRDIRNSPSVNLVRFRSGQILAQEAPLSRKEVDFVCGVPGTGITGGQGFANQLFLPYVQAIADKAMPKEEQRTFMEADVDGILKKVFDHFDIAEDMFEGKRVVIVDDSIVRGNVTKGLVKLLKNHCQAEAVHLRIVCPPVDKPCYLGINTREQEELIVYQMQGDIDKVCQEVGADSLAYLSAKGLKQAITNDNKKNGFCMGCMLGQKPPINTYGKLYKS